MRARACVCDVGPWPDTLMGGGRGKGTLESPLVADSSGE